MPIFEYICRTCHHRFETLVTGGRVPPCPACQARTLDKQLSVFAVATRSGGVAASPSDGACGTCGDARGPGACRLN